MIVPSVKADTALLPAFPGAEGFGYAAVGGRGGEVYHVTSYELKGPGTFHDALTTAGETPRTIVFDISGEITIPQIVLRDKSNITIAGQTASGDGVTIRGNNIRFIDCSDIIIRYVRFRLGVQSFNDDTMYFEDCQNVIIDHSTFSWGTDEVLSIKSKDYENPKSKNITVQWSIISEGLLTHSMGGLIEMNTISMHHNLYAHNNDRNPKTKGQIDFVNNIVYNWGGFPYVAGGESGTKGYGNVVGNYFIAGKNSADPEYAIVRGNENYSVYIDENFIDSNKNGILDGTDTGTGIIEAERPSVVMPERFEYPPVHTQDPETAYNHVLDHAGASLVRDAVDKRVINSVKNQTGVIIGNENDVGGFPLLESGTSPVDTDRDGMPDDWEQEKGLNPTDPEDRNEDRNGNGYTNLEEYLNELAAPGFPANYPTTPPEWSGIPFEPPVEPEPEPTPEPVESMNGDIMRNVRINDNSSNGNVNEANWSVQKNLQIGDMVAGDRMTGSKVYRFQSIPDELKGMEWIRTAVGSRSATSEDLVSFYLTADADVYVAHDSRITDKPEWLLNFYEDTGKRVQDDQPVEYTLYKKHYSAGSYVAMGANNNTSKMNYFIIIKPTNTGEAPIAVSPSGLKGELNEDAAISLNWTSVSAADAYLIYRSSAKDPVFRTVASTKTPEYVDAAVEQGITYQYKVSALNAGGESPLSDAVEVFTFDSTQPVPSPPAGLSVPVTKSLSVKLDWAPVENAISYYLFRATEEDGSYKKIGSTSTAEYVDDTVLPSTTYYYKVSTIAIGGESEKTNSVKTTTKPPVALPKVPTGLASGKVTTSAFEMKWTSVDGAESYNIYRKASGDSAFSKVGSTTLATYLDDSISVSNTGYTYRITAVNEMGETKASDELTISMPVPNTPSDLTVGLVGESFVGLIWTSNGGENQVNIYREANGKVEYVGYAKVNTYYDRTAIPGVEYTYYIKAQNASGESERSNTVKVKPGFITVLENYMNQFSKTADLTGPLVSQLTNTLKQAEDHAEKGSKEKAVTFMKKYVEQLNQKTMEPHISAEAKLTLSYYAKLFIKKLES
ncbi:pectinesterase [Bacillus sp. SA1-12]|nr:pectinesterase [Bacillus sp. SA1-12]